MQNKVLKFLSPDVKEIKMRSNNQMNYTSLNLQKEQQGSQSFLPTNEAYSQQDLKRSFDIIAQGQRFIDSHCLVDFLQEQGEPTYRAIEMVSLLDRNKKGYVSIEEFLDYFEKGIKDQQPMLSPELTRNQEWVREIQNNYQQLSIFFKPEVCAYAAKKLGKKQN